MAKGENSLSIRGVFFVFLILLLILPLEALAQTDIGLDYEAMLELDTFRLDSSIQLALNHQLNSHQIVSGKVSYSNNTLAWTKWRWEWNNRHGVLQLLYNAPHLTSKDSFRVLRQSNFYPNALQLLFKSNNDWTLLISENTPVKNGIPSKLLFFQGSFYDIKTTLAFFESFLQWVQINERENWDFRRNYGTVFVLDGKIKEKIQVDWSVGLIDRNDLSRGSIEKQFDLAGIIKLSQKISPNFNLNFEGYHIGKNFSSPLTHLNLYTPNRQGVKFNIRFISEPFILTYSHEHVVNIDGTTSYPSFNQRIEYQEEPVRFSAIIEWLPKPRLSLSANGDRTHLSLQFTESYPIGRLVWKPNPNVSLRFDYHFLHRYRFELGINSVYDLSYVYKFEPQTSRKHQYFSLKRRFAARFWELRYGESDNGNLLARFDDKTNWRVFVGFCF